MSEVDELIEEARSELFGVGGYDSRPKRSIAASLLAIATMMNDYIEAQKDAGGPCKYCHGSGSITRFHQGQLLEIECVCPLGRAS